jgi:2-dehydro-3-deoxyphosphogluconate aldolase/(4S)-4-hydroxy-2-oxoglutarate aldolase
MNPHPIFDPKLLETISQTPLVAGFSVEDPLTAVPIARALLKGGIRVIELTLRTDAALEAIKLISDEVPEIILGVGTILSPEQLVDVQNAGATFGVAPGLHPAVVQAAKEQQFSFAPGVLTPSEIEQALGLGCRFLKIFPAETAGGLPYLKSIYAPYQHLGLSFFPLGGINENNLHSYVQFPAVKAAGGSWLVKSEDVKNGRYDLITERCQTALSKI